MPALRDVLSYKRTDAKLMIKAVDDDIDPYTIEIPSGLSCNTHFLLAFRHNKHTLETFARAQLRRTLFPLLTSRRDW